MGEITARWKESVLIRSCVRDGVVVHTYHKSQPSWTLARSLPRAAGSGASGRPGVGRVAPEPTTLDPPPFSPATEEELFDSNENRSPSLLLVLR